MAQTVRCIYSSGDDGFTVGKEYDVVSENESTGDVDVVDDAGDVSYLLEEEYEIVS